MVNKANEQKELMVKVHKWGFHENKAFLGGSWLGYGG